MITSQEDFDKSGYKDLIELECEKCHSKFEIEKRKVKSSITKYGGQKFCSKKCQSEAQRTGKTYSCKFCQNQVYRSEFESRSPKEIFCSRSCVAKYYKKQGLFHPKDGRSKLERWLEIQLTDLYSNLEIVYNNRKVINSELDIYIPLLKLAFELNGIFHYEPIFGQEKLKYTQNNDSRKFQACLDRKIELCIIDTSRETYFKEQKGKKYLDIIRNVIDLKLLL